jgi:2-(3-amino-3-carboxypropyl)histidine synthase
MKQLFIEAKYKGKITINKKEIDKLPDKIALFTTVQFIDQLKDVKKQLKNKAIITKGKQKHPGQILGCDTSAATKEKNCLYIGTGNFHPIALALLNKTVFTLDPFQKTIKKLDQKIVENYKKRKKAAMLKFLNAKNVGILISTKPGQKYRKDLTKLEKKYKDKKFYFFITNNIDINQFENFRFIQAWINTACPRLEEDYILLNINDLIR